MDWANLNSNLLRHIAKKIHNIFDIIRLRAVCTSWRLAVLPSDLSPQLPLFIHFRRKVECKNYIEIINPFAERTNSVITSKESINNIIFGSSARYVLLYDCSSLSASIINPFTGSRISIPFQTERDVSNFVVAPHSSPDGNAIDVMFCSSLWLDRAYISLAYLWRYDGNKWLKIMETPYRCYDEEVCYNNGKLYFFSTMKIRAIDVQRGGLEYVISNSPVPFNYLIEAFGKLIGVRKVLNPPTNMPLEHSGKYLFEVYWLDNNSPNWSKINNGFENWIIFLDQHSGFCIKADDFDGFKGNCIYFATFGMHDGLVIRYLIRYDMELRKSQVLSKYNNVCQGGGHWFVPGVH